MASALDALSSLGKPGVVEEVSFEAILQAMRDDAVARLPSLASVIDLESEPARIILEAAAYRETMIRARANDVARANLLAFAGGTDLDHLAAFYDVARLSGEADVRLRERVVLAIQGRSTGGTAARYRYVAMTSSIDVADAIVWVDSLTPKVMVAVLSSSGGGVASAELVQTVSEALNSPDVKMVNDTISVMSAVNRVVDVSMRIWTLPDSPVRAVDVEQAVRDSWVAEGGIGFDMPLAWVCARAMIPGVQRVSIVSPEQDVSVNPYEAVALGSVTVEIVGRAR